METKETGYKIFCREKSAMRFLTSVVIISGLIFILLTGYVSAKDCGGSTRCECGDTLTSSHVMDYDLENCSGRGIEMNGWQITLDCNGHTIGGDNQMQRWSYGIDLTQKWDSAIINCVITGFYNGIYLSHVSGSSLINNTVSSNVNGIYLINSGGDDLINNTVSSNVNGIYLNDSGGNDLIGNVVSSNGKGIYLADDSQSNHLTNNSVSSNTHGIFLNNSGDNHLRNNTMTGNAYNFNIDGYIDLGYEYQDDYYQDIDTSNTVDGKPIYYWTFFDNAPNNCTNAEIPNDAGFVALWLCDNITIKNLNLNKNSHGVLLVDTKNSNILNNTITLNRQGVYLDDSSRNNNLTENIINSNNEFGINLWMSSGINVINNTINSNNETGIHLWSSSGINIINNTINSNNNHGINLIHSSNNNITGNTVNSNDGSGVHILEDSTLNTLAGNEISENKYGVFFRYDGYLNDITSNTICLNTAKDIYDLGSNSDGMPDDNNTCDSAHNWNDYGSIKCTGKCIEEENDPEQLVCFWASCINQQCSAVNPETQHNSLITGDWSYIMESYKCFLGLNRNCNFITHQ